MNNNVITFYTLDEAREIIKKQENREKQIRKYYIKQKIIGLILILVAIIAVVIEKDITLMFFFIPFGILLIFTKKKVIILWKDFITVLLIWDLFHQ